MKYLHGNEMSFPLNHGDWVLFSAPEGNPEETEYPGEGWGHIINPRLLDKRHNEKKESHYLNWPKDWTWGIIYIPPEGKKLTQKQLEVVCVAHEYDSKVTAKSALPYLYFGRILRVGQRSPQRRGRHHRMRLPHIPLEEV